MEQRLRVAMIGQKGVPALYGGVERHVEELACGLTRQGVEVSVYTRPHYTSRARRSYRGVHLVSVPSLHTKHLDAISHTFLATLHALRSNVDVIHYHGVGPSLLSFLPRLLGSRVKVVATIHCLDRKHQKWGPLARLALWFGEWCALTFPHETIAVSRSIQRYCVKTYGKQPRYVPNGVSQNLARGSHSLRTLKRFNLEPDGYVLCVTRLIKHKGVHRLIEAYKRTTTRKKLVIVGDGVFTDTYVRSLFDLAARDPRIVFTGFQHGQALTDLFRYASLFVLPSENEGLPIVLLEAASFGLGVLVSDIPENREVLASPGTALGVTFRTRDVGDLARKLATLLRQPALRRRLGAEAKRSVTRRYNWSSISQETRLCYTTIVGESSIRTALATPRAA